MSIILDNVGSPHLSAGVTLGIGPGVHGLIGPNGAGKTTLLRLMAGHHRPRTGSLSTPRTALARAGADACFAGRHLADHFAVAAVGHPGFDPDLAAEVLDVAGLGPGTSFRGLSVGHRQLVSLATALAAGAPVTLLDEPFVGLDVGTRKRIRQLLIREVGRRRDWTLVLSSHRSEDLAGLVTDVVVLHEGHAHGPHDLDEVRPCFPTLTGPAELVDAVVAKRPTIERDLLGPTLRVTLAGALDTTAEGVSVTLPTDRTLIDLLSTGVDPHAPEGR